MIASQENTPTALYAILSPIRAIYMQLYALSHIIAYKSRFLGQKNPFFVRLGLQNGAWRSSLRYGRNSAWTYI
jgi:hypothetical protein